MAIPKAVVLFFIFDNLQKFILDYIFLNQMWQYNFKFKEISFAVEVVDIPLNFN
tara:strand:+ start:1487 stop:1648 length:162 start_codon:yes stop_codon:yes gene_type:complete